MREQIRASHVSQVRLAKASDGDDSLDPDRQSSKVQKRSQALRMQRTKTEIQGCTGFSYADDSKIPDVPEVPGEAVPVRTDESIVDSHKAEIVDLENRGPIKRWGGDEANANSAVLPTGH